MFLKRETINSLANSLAWMCAKRTTIAVSVLEANAGEICYLDEKANTSEAVKRLVRQLRKCDVKLSFCYEAGPCEYEIHRQLTVLGWNCQGWLLSLPACVPGPSPCRYRCAPSTRNTTDYLSSSDASQDREHVLDSSSNCGGAISVASTSVPVLIRRSRSMSMRWHRPVVLAASHGLLAGGEILSML